MVVLSLIIPTYNEKENISILIKNLFELFSQYKISAEIIVVDDNSPDGTSEMVKKLKNKFSKLHLLSRTAKTGLSSAVLAGFDCAKGEILGVMDADMSHPPQLIPQLYNAIITPVGYDKRFPDFVIGSRYVKGGKIVGWPLFRRIVSKGATFLSRPFTKAKDPMSGFFLIKKKCIEGKRFNAKGFKICLELLVKSNWKIVKEVPITFTDRVKGKSKANFKEYYLYLYNLWNYFIFKFF
ncbi:polyprenol monophosphomannose synthase [Candidatus Woesearchaeota archaeon]|jgi:dolichol-phosphate mannosyltransferase|nr:polyprenol monophosphomannose synthase [Candidatus Woesearchaeota archaeon]